MYSPIKLENWIIKMKERGFRAYFPTHFITPTTKEKEVRMMQWWWRRQGPVNSSKRWARAGGYAKRAGNGANWQGRNRGNRWEKIKTRELSILPFCFVLFCFVFLGNLIAQFSFLDYSILFFINIWCILLHGHVWMVCYYLRNYYIFFFSIMLVLLIYLYTP